jgi:CUT domain
VVLNLGRCALDLDAARAPYAYYRPDCQYSGSSMEVNRPSSSDGLVSSLHPADRYDNSFVYADENRSSDVLADSLRQVNSPNGEIQIVERTVVNSSATSGERIDCWSPVVSDRAFSVAFADRTAEESQILRQNCAVEEGGRSAANCANILEVDSSGETMIDAVDCRQHQVQHLSINGHHQNAGRLSVVDQPVSYAVGQNGSDLNNGGSTYAMLTTLKPLPPISTVSERLGSNGSGFVFMQDCNGGLNQSNTGNSSYNSYKYETLEANEMQLPTNCNGYQSSVEASSASLRINNAGYVSTLASQYSPYGQPANCHVQLHPVKSEMMGSMVTMNNMSVYEGPSGYTNGGRMVSSLPVEMQAKQNGEMMHPGVDSFCGMHGNISPPSSSLVAPLHQTRIAVEHSRQVMVSQHRVGSPDQPSSSTDLHGGTVKSLRPSENGGSSSGMEEISTREVAQRVSNELKRYSIPQAVFAQRVLGRSQGTLSDLLRNPKPWSKLKSGRETFRRMWKWLQEPEYQRMAALRSSKNCSS